MDTVMTPDEIHAASAQVVYERQDSFDLQTGPYGYEKVGFRIGDRIFWVGCSGSGLPSTPADDALAQEVVKRWNANRR